MRNLNNYSQILENALAWGQKKHPQSNNFRHSAFANSVAYLITGASGGYGGPSVREHLVSWTLMGVGAQRISAMTNVGELALQFPDGKLPSSGDWEYEKALLFCEPICYGELNLSLARQILASEHCFDNDPDDLKILSYDNS